MHLEKLFLHGDDGSQDLEWDFTADPGSLRKWTLLPVAERHSEVFPLVALAGCGARHVQALAKQFDLRHLLCRKRCRTFEFVHVRHAPQERGEDQPARRHGGWILAPNGIHQLPRRKARPIHPGLRFSATPIAQNSKAWLIIGYGSRLRPHLGTDHFLLDDPHQRLRRCAPLFEPNARLTDPPAFLAMLNYRGISCGRGRSREYLSVLNRELGSWIGMPPDAWLNLRHDFARDWKGLLPSQKAIAALVLDVARHVMDASVGLFDPRTQPGLVLFDGFSPSLSEAGVAPCLLLLDRLFPNLQFIARLSKQQQALVPPKLLSRTLPLPQITPRAKRPGVRLRSGTALLIDVDGTLPNLALMKIGHFLKQAGQRVALARVGVSVRNPSAVYASCIYSLPGSIARVSELRRQFGADLQLGGSGVDLQQRLPPEIESLDPDYSLYPELGDRAIGFLTRGCPRHCRFCVVPQKEGKPRLDTDLDRLLQGRKKLILLDDNLLAHPMAPRLLEEMVRRKLQVNFNQTLDLRLLTPETAALLRRIDGANVKFTRRVLHFSLNDNHGLQSLRRCFELLQTTSRDHIEFVCMYGFNTTLAEDLERFQFLRTLPGAYVFVQRYRPPLGARVPDFSRFFDDQADQHLDSLVRVIFPQNMKSMEVYYRWICHQYASQCGKIHQGLVETLFRYNHRHLMGRFLARLEAQCREGRSNPDQQPTFRIA